jgi:hypothetical protein
MGRGAIVAYTPNLAGRRLVRRIKELQPEASQRAIAEAIGVSHTTVDHDVSGGNKLPRSQDDGPATTDEPGNKLPSTSQADEADEGQEVAG